MERSKPHHYARHAVAKPRVWFERDVLDDLLDEVASKVVMLGPGTDTPDDPYVALADAQGAVAGADTYDAAVMDRGPRLEVIARTGIGVDKVDIAAATERGIAICNTPDGPTISTAEHAVALMAMVAKNVKWSEAELRRGGTDLYGRHEGVELAGKVLGLVGCGRIARHTGRIAAAFGMRVAAFDPYLAPGGFPEGIEPAADLVALLGAADVVSVHVPLTDGTRHLFDADLFAAMKPGAVFINTARGGVVDQKALVAALDSGHLKGAGLDVTDPEPLPPDHQLLHRDDVVVTAHVASATHDSKRRIFRMAFEQVVQVLEGNRPAHLVNPEVWEGVAAAR